MVARQVRRSVVMSNLQIRLLPMDSDRTPLEKGKDVLHGAARAAPLRQSVEQPWGIGKAKTSNDFDLTAVGGADSLAGRELLGHGGPSPDANVWTGGIGRPWHQGDVRLCF